MTVNILHIIDSGGLYGAEMVLLTLAAGQKDMGCRPVVASIGSRGEKTKPLEARAQRQGIEIIPFRFRNGPNVLGAWEILRYAHARRIQVLHAHGYKADILLGFIPKKLRRLPVVSTVHGWTGIEPFSKIRLYECLDGLSLRHMDAVSVVNENMLNHPRLKNLPQEMVYVIRNGIPNLDVNKPLPDDEITEFSRQGFTIVSIGRLSKEKGHEYLLQALSLLLTKGVDARLLIIGEGHERFHLEEIVRRLDLATRVMLPGYRQDAWRYLARCNVFVLSSLTEGLPITLLEAMQMGIPVVATAVGGIPSLIKTPDTGILVPPRSPHNLAESIADIYNDNITASQMAQMARKFVYRECSVGRMCQSYMELYLKVLNKMFSGTKGNKMPDREHSCTLN